MLTIILSSLIAVNANAQQGNKAQRPQQQQQIQNRNPQTQRTAVKQNIINQNPTSTAENFSRYKKSEGGQPLSPMTKLPPKPDSQFVNPAKGKKGSHVNWGMQNGMGYCYEWTNDGDVLNAGQPIPNENCSEILPMYSDWGFGENGFGYCYQFTPDGYVLNNAEKVEENFCENIAPSYYTWDRSEVDGNIYCYRKTGNYDYLMNLGYPYDNNFCRK